MRSKNRVMKLVRTLSLRRSELGGLGGLGGSDPVPMSNEGREETINEDLDAMDDDEWE